MGRSAWSFNNKDMEATHYFRKPINGGLNVNRIKEIQKYENRYSQNWKTLKGKIENYVWTENPETSVYVGNMKGRGYLDYSGWVENGFELQINFDGQKMINSSTGDYSITTIPIPSGTQYVNIKLTGSYPSYFQNATNITTYPFSTRIYGIPKF